MLKNFTVAWEWIYSHMKRIKSVLRSSIAEKRITTWPFWTLSKTLSTKWTLQTLLIYSQLQKPGKDCFVLKTCNFGFRRISFSFISVPKIILLLVQFEKKILFQFFFANFAFSNVISQCSTLVRKTVVRAILQAYGKWWISTPWGAETAEPIEMKLDMGDYVGDPTPHAQNEKCT